MRRKLRSDLWRKTERSVTHIDCVVVFLQVAIHPSAHVSLCKTAAVRLYLQVCSGLASPGLVQERPHQLCSANKTTKHTEQHTLLTLAA